MCVPRVGGVYKGNSFLFIADYRWQDHMEVLQPKPLRVVP